MDRLVIASNNKGKLREIKAILSPFFDEIVSMKEVGIDVDVVEDGNSFHENASKKAVQISELTDATVLADDSGLCVDALLGAPGIYSARYAGEGADDEQNNRKLLQAMQGEKNRNARFVAAIVLAKGGRELLYVEDSVEGVLLDKPLGDGGFGYDPLFYMEEYGQTFGQIDPDIKNHISHRAKALRRLQEKLQAKKK